MQLFGTKVNDTNCHQRRRGDVVTQHRKKEFDIDITAADVKKPRL
jgi:hypothetical protein